MTEKKCYEILLSFTICKSLIFSIPFPSTSSSSIPSICFGLTNSTLKCHLGGFLGGSVDKNLPANAGNMGSIPDPERFHMC